MAARAWRRRRNKPWSNVKVRRYNRRVIRQANGIVPGTERLT